MADTYELTPQNYEDCHRKELLDNMPKVDFSNILSRPDFQELTINLLENHEYYALTEGEAYCIENEYFLWNGQKMVQIPDTEITEEMQDDRLDITSEDYAQKFKEDYEDEIEKNMPEFENIEQMPEFEKWVYKTIKFMKYEPAHGDIIDVACAEYRNNGKYQWDEYNKKLVNLYTIINDYGSCSPMFRVGDQPGEFSPWHWHATKSCAGPGFTIYYGAIDHNTIVFLSKKLVSEINTKLVLVESKYRCDIVIAGVTYKVISTKPVLNPERAYDCGFSYDHEVKTFNN